MYTRKQIRNQKCLRREENVSFKQFTTTVGKNEIL